MANPFGMQEVTLANLGDSTHAINTIDATGAVAASPRKSVYQPIVAIVTDHEDTTSSLTGWTDGGGSPTDTPANEEYMKAGIAVFMCRRHGEQWEQQFGHKKHIIAKATAGSALVVNTTTVGNIITVVAIGSNAGTGYAKGDTLTVATGTGALLLVTSVLAGVVTGVALLKGGTGYSNVTGAVTSGLIPVDVTNLYADFDYSTFE